MTRKSKRVFIDTEFHSIAKQICEDTKINKRIKRYEISDLTAQLVPVLEELQKRMKKERLRK